MLLLLIPQCIILFLSFTLEYLIFPDSTQSYEFHCVAVHEITQNSMSLHPMTSLLISLRVPDCITLPPVYLNFTPEYFTQDSITFSYKSVTLVLIPNFHFSPETLFYSIPGPFKYHSFKLLLFVSFSLLQNPFLCSIQLPIQLNNSFKPYYFTHNILTSHFLTSESGTLFLILLVFIIIISLLKNNIPP